MLFRKHPVRFYSNGNPQIVLLHVRTQSLERRAAIIHAWCSPILDQYLSTYIACCSNTHYPWRAKVPPLSIIKSVDMWLSKISPVYNTRLDLGTGRTTRRKRDLPHRTFLLHQTCWVEDSTEVSNQLRIPWPALRKQENIWYWIKVLGIPNLMFTKSILNYTKFT